MTRRRVVRSVALLGVVLAVVIPITARPAAAAPAQPPSLIPIETLIPVLQQLQPALEIVSPIVWPQCANALLVSVLPGALGVETPPALSAVTGPLLVICGAVPQPLTNTRSCKLDAQAYDLVAVLTKPVLGSGPPLEVAPGKWVTGLLDNIVDRVNLAAVPIGSTIAGVFQCTDPSPSTTTTTAAGVAASAPTPSVAAPLGEALAVPTFEDLQTLPALDPALVTRRITPIASVPNVRFINQPRFRYPVVMALPLVFIALLVFFGRALTRPLLVKEDQL